MKFIHTLIHEYKKSHTSYRNQYDLSGTKRYKVIFIHIPKTGGVAINHALFSCLGAGHLSYKQYADQFKMNEYFIFSIVRNPLDRFISAYSFLEKGGLNKAQKDLQAFLLSKGSVEEFISKGIDQNFWNLDHFKPQVSFLINESNDIKLDFIGKFENIKKDFSFVCQKNGLKLKPLPVMNSNSEKRTISQESKLLIKEYYKLDYDTFYINQ